MRRFSILFAAALLTGCRATAPHSCESQCTRADALAGARAALVAEAQYGGVIHDPQAEQRMGRVGTRLSQANPETRRPYQYHVLDSDRLDALSLPGGRIYVTRGLFVRLDTDGLLAAVLAHEMGHIAAADHVRPRVGDRYDTLKREIAADARGAEYLVRAGIDPQAMISVVRLVDDGQPSGWVVLRAGTLRARINRIEPTNQPARP